ncbi:translation metalloprotein YbeY [Clostridiales bacterium KA00134]|nr:translation metalloprotein YbeY [Clostridiales bacterium KA00134]
MLKIKEKIEMIEIDYSNRQDYLDIDENTLSFVEAVVRETLEEEDIKSSAYVSISFVGDEEIKTLNRDYRNVDDVTDVLSFPIDEFFDSNTRILGDVVINVKRLMSQAEEFGHSYERELGYLTCHSILHLLGYDHIDDEDKKIMRDKEDAIMHSLDLTR